MKSKVSGLNKFKDSSLSYESMKTVSAGDNGHYVYVDDGGVTHVYWHSHTSGSYVYIRTIGGLIA